MFGFGKRKEKAAAGSGTAASYFPGGTATWTPRDYDNFAKEAYMKNDIAFRCIDMIAKSVSSIPWCLKKSTPEGEIEVIKDPFLDVLKRPNPKQSWQTFLYNSVSFLLLNGNSFISRVSLSGGYNGGRVRELHCHRPSRITMDVDKATNTILAYRYQQSAEKATVYPVEPVTGKCDMLQIKSFNPIDDIWGMAIVEPAARGIDTSNAATEWNKGLLDNQARPGMLIFFERMLAEPVRKILKKDLVEFREGAKNAGKSLILEGANDAKPYSLSPVEMDFTEGANHTDRKIASAFGVPPQLLNIKGDSTFANYEQARQVFWEDTVIYYLSLFKSELNSWLFFNDASGIYLDYDIENVPALAYRQEKKWERASKATFISPNEKRELTGYDAKEGEGYDAIYMPASEIPIGADLIVDETPPVGDEGVL